MTEESIRVLGVVGAMGPSFGRSPDDPWRMTLVLAPWRREGGEVVRSPLYLGTDIEDPDHVDAAIRAIAPATVIAVRCRMKEAVSDEERAGKLARAELLGIDGPAGSDAALEAAADEQRKPVKVTSELCGELVFDPRLDAFEGKWRDCQVVIARSGDGDDVTDCQNGEALIRRLEGDLEAITTRVADKLLVLYNGAWREEGAPALDVPAFGARIRLTVIDVDGEDVTLWYDDGDLFAGHAIEVAVHQDGTLVANITG